MEYLAILAAAVAGFFLGWGWYAALGKPWQRALGWSAEECKNQKMPALALALAFLADLASALGLFMLFQHMQVDNVFKAGSVAATIGVLFVLTTTAANNAFQKRSHVLTLIDGGHWIAVLLVESIVLVAFPA